MRTNDIVLVFPPVFNPGEIHLALPSLKAYLEIHGYDAYILDANAVINDVILSKKFLKEVFSEQQELLGMSSAKIEELINSADEAKNSFRSEKFYSLEYYVNALYTIQKTMEVMDRIFKPYGGLLIENFGADQYQRDSNTAATLIKQDKVIYAFLYERYIIPEILKCNTKLVGISITFSDQLIPSLLLARKLKDLDKDLKILVGGNIVTHLHKNMNFLRLLALLNVDIGVIYEGEYALLKTVELFSKKEELPRTFLTEIPNVMYLYNNRSYRLPERIHIQDFNDLPTPNFDGLPFDKYLTPHVVFPLLTSRGCYWSKCVFCNIPYGYGPKCRLRDVELVINDLTRLIDKYNAKYIAFRDCCIPPEYMYNLCKRIVESGLDVKMYAEIRAEETFRYKHFRKAYEAGFRVLWVGVESYNQRILNLMRKGINHKGIINCLTSMKRGGIWVHIYIILGFPGETEEEALETINSILTSRNIDSVEFSCFTLVENSPMISQDMAEKYGIAQKHIDHDSSLIYRYTLKESLLQEENERIIGHLNSVYSNKSQSLFNFMIPSYGTWGLLYVSKLGVDSVKKKLRTFISSYSRKISEDECK